MVSDGKRMMALLAEAKRLAREYYGLTGKPLGVTDEVAEYDAARLLASSLPPDGLATMRSSTPRAR